jgi:hypothetical protein
MDDRDSRLQSGLDRLAVLGVAGPQTTVEDLERALAAEPGAALAIADRLGGIVSPRSAELLRRIEASTAHDKALRREVRRSLYRLKQKGVASAEPAAAPGAAPMHAPQAAPEAEGYLSISDPFGDRLVWVVKPRPGGGLFHLSTVVNEPAGLKEAVLAEVNRKSLRSLRQELEARHALRLVDVDWRYCDWISFEGYERARARGAAERSVIHYPQLRLQVFTTPARPANLPTLASSPDALAESASLLEEPELQSWFVGEDVLAEHLSRYREIRDSPIVLDRAAQLSRVEQIVEAAIEGVFAPERAAAWQRRLEEASHFFSATSRPQAAARAAAAAKALGEHPGGKGIPLCEQLVRRTFAAFFAREAEREREEKSSSVLVTPDDIRAAQARARSAPARSKP